MDHSPCQQSNSSEDETVVQGKAFEIPKSLVWFS